jgi:hypothetical protein
MKIIYLWTQTHNLRLQTHHFIILAYNNSSNNSLAKMLAVDWEKELQSQSTRRPTSGGCLLRAICHTWKNNSWIQPTRWLLSTSSLATHLISLTPRGNRMHMKTFLCGLWVKEIMDLLNTSPSINLISSCKIVCNLMDLQSIMFLSLKISSKIPNLCPHHLIDNLTTNRTMLLPPAGAQMSHHLKN